MVLIPAELRIGHTQDPVEQRKAGRSEEHERQLSNDACRRCKFKFLARSVLRFSTFRMEGSSSDDS